MRNGDDEFNIFLLTLFGVVAVFIILFTTLALIFGWENSDTPPPCSHYANYSVRDVPARCLSYFEKDKN